MTDRNTITTGKKGDKVMKKKAKGFTLVEIMIVVAIIGLLIAIALPNFVRARKKSMIRASQASMKQMEGAVEQSKLDGTVFASWTEAVVSNGIVPEYIKIWPRCPGGGTWNFPSNSVITCTIDDINGGLPYDAYEDVSL